MLTLTPSTPLTASATPVHLSEKLPDIPEYDGDRDKLDAWEHALIQRMHVNHNQYPPDTATPSMPIWDPTPSPCPRPSVSSLLTSLTLLTASATPVHLSEKLSDIPEYDEDRDKLNT